MASWLLPGKKSNQNLLPRLQQKSRIPVKIAHPSSESDGSLDKKVRLHKESERKLQNKLSSRIPIVVDRRKTKVDTKDNLPTKVKTSRREKAFGRDSGINLREIQGKKDKRNANAIPSTTANYGSYWRAKETTLNVRRRVPKQLTLIETESKQVCSDEKEPREESSASEVSSAARKEDVAPDFKFNVAPVHEICMAAEADISGSEFGDDFEQQSKSSDEKAMPNVHSWLREEHKEREELNKDINIVKDDTAVSRAAKDFRLELEFDTEEKLDKNILGEEELVCSSSTESSGYKRKMAELDEKSRRLKAQFAEENRQAIESMNKIVDEIKQSKAREDTIANEIEEMRRRQDQIKDDLKRLDEIGQRRETDDKKWREMMDRKKKRVARRLEKIRAERDKYQEVTADGNGSKEEHDQQDENLNENPEDDKYKHFTMENETVMSEDNDNKLLLYEPLEIKKNKSVKELEKQKEVRRFGRLEKKAIKRKKLEQRERKKIEKRKRKVARKLEKLSAKSSKISYENSEASKCINQPMESSNAATKEKFDETPRVSATKLYADRTSDGSESKEVQTARSPGLPANGAEFEKFEEKLSKVENKVELEDKSYSNVAKKVQKACNYSDEQKERVTDDVTDAEILCFGREDTLDDISAELDDISAEQLSLEVALGLDQEGNEKIQVEPEKRGGFLPDYSAPVSSRTGCQEPFKEDKEKHHLGERVATSCVGYFPWPNCSEHDENRLEDEPVEKDVSVSNSEESNSYGGYKLDLFNSFSPVTNQTSLLTRKTSGKFTSLGLQPLWSSPDVTEGNPILEDSDFVVDESKDSEHTNKNCNNNELSRQLEKRSTENEQTRGEDQSQLRIEGSHDHSGDTLTQVNRPITYRTAPLTRKVSGRFTPFGLQPLWRSPEMVEDNPILENSDSILDESVKSEHTNQNHSSEDEPRQLEKKSTENEANEGEDQSQSMSEGHGQSGNTLVQVNHPVTFQTAPLTRKVSGRFTPFGLQPLWHSTEMEENNPILKDSDSIVDQSMENEQYDHNYSNENVPQQLESRSTENEENSCEDQSQLMSEGSYSQSSDALQQVNRPGTYRTAPLTRKVSGRFTPCGLQPLWRSLEVREGNPILEDSDSIVDQSVESEHYDHNYSKENVPQQLENRSTENEENSCEDQSQLMSEGSHSQSSDALQQVNRPGTYRTAPLTRKVSGRFTPFGLQPLWSSPELREGNPILEDSDSIVEQSVESEHHDHNYSKENVPQQLGNRSTENEENSCEDQSQLMSEGSHSQSSDAVQQVNRPVTYRTTPLTRKVSGRFTPFGLQPLWSSLEVGEGNPILEDSDSIVEQSVESEHHDHSYSNENVPQQLGNRSTENEENSCEDQSQLMSEGSHSQSSDAVQQVNGPVTYRTAPLTRKVSGRFTPFGLQPLWNSAELGGGKSMLEDSDSLVEQSVESEHHDHNYSKENVPKHVENRSTENEANTCEDAQSGDALERVNLPVTYQTAPLIINVAGRFRPFGPQPLYRSPEKEENNQILKNADSTVDELVDSGHSNQNYNCVAVPQQPQNRFTENEVNSNDDANETSCSDVPNGFREVPRESSATCSDEKIGKNSDSKMSCRKETHHPFKTDPFANFVKRAGDDSHDEKAPVQLLQEEVISSSASQAKCSIADGNGYKNKIPLKGVESYSQKDDSCDLFKDSKQVISSSVHLPEQRAGSKTLEVTASTTDTLEGDEDSKRQRTNLEDTTLRNIEKDVCVQFEETLTANELKPRHDANNTCTFSSDIPEELEILLVSWVSSHTEEESVYHTDAQVICEEEDSCISNVDALSTTCHEDISMAAYKTKMGRKQENGVSDRRGKMYNVDGMIYKTEAAVISEESRFENHDSLSVEQSERGRLKMENTSSTGNHEKETQQLEKELAEKEGKSCNNAEDTVYNDRPKQIEMAHTQNCREIEAAVDNSSLAQKDGKDTESLNNYFQVGEKQKMTESKEDPWKETEVLVKSSVAPFDDEERNLSSIRKKGDSILQKKAKVCNFGTLNDKKGKVSDGKATFSPDNENSIEEEFIDEFDRFLDEVEGDILTEETMSHISHSAENESSGKNVDECSALPSYERSVATDVKISEYLFKKDLSTALETDIPDNREDCTLRLEETSSEEELQEKRKHLAGDTYRPEGVIEYRYAIGIALKTLNHVNSMLAEAREQLLGRRGTYGCFAAQEDTELGTVGLLNSVSVLNDTVGDVMKDFKHAIERTEQEPKLHKENVEMECAQLKRENTELEMQISVIHKKLEAYQKRTATLQADLDNSNVEVKKLQLKEEYRERELVNLKRDFKNKEEKWEEGNETVEKVMADIKELWDDVDHLEESLKNSRESNEDLKFQVKELKTTIKEMNKEFRMEHSRGGCGHLREEVELLTGSLKLKEQRVVLLESQEARQFAQLAVKDKELNDFKEENLKVVCKLKDRFIKLSRENSTLTAELLEVLGKNDPVGEVNDETSTIVKQLRKEKAELREEKNSLTSELLQAYVEIESLKRVNGQVSNLVRLFEDELGRLKREHFMTDMPAISGKDSRWNEIKDEILGVVRQLQNKVSKLRKENSTLTEELLNQSENKRQLHETSKTISDFRDEIAKLEREKSTLFTELSANESEKYYQLYVLRCEKSRITRTFEEEITKLRKENSTLTTRLSKLAEINGKFTELREQVVALRWNNSVLKEELTKAKNRSANETQKGLNFEERLTIDVEGDATIEGDVEVNVKDILHLDREVNLDEGQKYKVQEMEEIIRDLRQNLQQAESDLELANSALRLKKERTDILERCLEEKEEILKITSQRQKQRENDIKQTEGNLRWQKERTKELKNQLINLTEAADASVKSKEKEVQEVYCFLKKQDETIKNLLEKLRQERCDKDHLELQFESVRNLETQLRRTEDINRNTFQPVDSLVHELREERSEKDRFKRAMEARECSSYEEKEPKKRLEQLEDQLQKKDELTNTTLTSPNNNKGSPQEANDEQEKAEKENLREASDASECNTNERNKLTQKIGKLEKQLQGMDDPRENTFRSPQEKEWSLEKAHNKIKELTRDIARERSVKEYFKTMVEAREGTAKEEKEQSEKTEEKLRIMNERLERAQASLKAKEQELDEMHYGIEKKDNRVKELMKELQRERSEKQSLRKAEVKAESKAQWQRELLDEKDNEVDKLKELVFDYKEKVENLNTNLAKLRKELEFAGEPLAYGNFDEILLFTMGIDYKHMKHIETETKRNTQQQGLLMAQLGKRLKNLVQRQREMYASSLLMTKKEAHKDSVLGKLREDLNEKEELMEDLKSCIQDSVNECSSMRWQLEHIQCENAHLKRCLGDKDEKVRMLEIAVKQLEEDLQKKQKCLRESEAGFVDANETLQLKCSLLRTMEAKLCLRSKEIDELTEANKEKVLEITCIETTLKEVKKELDIAASIIEKQNEQCANLTTCAMRKTRDAEGMQDELKRLSTQLECSRNEKANLHRAVLAATSRLESERLFAEGKQKAFQVEVNTGLKELNAKSKQYWDMKMDLREAAARISILEDDKVEQEENLAAFKGKVSRELNLLKKTQHAENEKLSSLQLTIGSAGCEMAKLTEENQRQLKIELLHNGLENNSSESSCEESTFSTLETRRGKAAYEKTCLEDENNVVASSQGDIKSKWVNTSSFKKRFETRRDRDFKRARTIAAHGSTNKVSILLCNG